LWEKNSVPKKHREVVEEAKTPSSEGRKEKGTRYHLPPRKDVQDVDDQRERCELCMFWNMKDPKQKQTSCYDRGYGAHDVCSSFTAKPPKVRHDLIREIQMYSMPEIFFIYDVLEERANCIRTQTKKLIRTLMRKQGGAVVYYKLSGEKKKRGKVDPESKISNLIRFKDAEDEKIRVDYVVEAISLDEYKARKTKKISERSDPGR
jgi:hypothetical protein